MLENPGQLEQELKVVREVAGLVELALQQARVAGGGVTGVLVMVMVLDSVSEQRMVLDVFGSEQVCRESIGRCSGAFLLARRGSEGARDGAGRCGADAAGAGPGVAGKSRRSSARSTGVSESGYVRSHLKQCSAESFCMCDLVRKEGLGMPRPTR